jgi:magnesium transporter
MPELGWQYGYPMVIGFMLLVFIVIYAWFRRKKWL